MASTEIRLSKAEIRRLHQEACREIACHHPGLCVFCPHMKEKK